MRVLASCLRSAVVLTAATLAACGGGGGGGGGAPANPVPVASSLSPTSTRSGGASFVLTVNGSSFISGSAIAWNGAALPTTFVSTTQLTSQVPAADIASAGSAAITVVNPAPGGGGSGALTLTIAPDNVAALSVDGFGGNGGFNSLYVTITVCPHGSSTNCQTIDHIAVDTGSIGLRVLATSASGLLAGTPTITATSADPANPNTHVTGILAECAQFGGGYTWGSVRNVDITFAGTNETALNMPMQVMGDMEPAPAACVSQSATQYELTGSTTTNGVTTANPLTFVYLHANGLVGMSVFPQDCGGCTTAAQPPEGTGNSATLAYTVCTDMTGSACTPTTEAQSQQVANPVPMLARDNNGYLIQMGAIASPGGAVSVAGSMIFGVGTQSNNALGSAAKYLANPAYQPGFVTTTYKGVGYPYATFDTGSSLFYFPDSSIPTCGTTVPYSQIYCPGGANATSATPGITLSLTAQVQNYLSDASPSDVVPFQITNPNVTLASTSWAADNVGGTQVFSDFLWGMPFFYGKTVYFGITSPVNNYANPYYAF
jgi:hypothetical protein